MNIKTTSLIIENKLGKILLQVRDNKPSLPFPGKLDTIGGSIEGTELPLEALQREISEELPTYNPKPITFWKKFYYENYEIFVFLSKDHGLDNEPLPITEGERSIWVGLEEFENLEFAYNSKEVIREYFSRNQKIL